MMPTKRTKKTKSGRGRNSRLSPKSIEYIESLPSDEYYIWYSSLGLSISEAVMGLDFTSVLYQHYKAGTPKAKIKQLIYRLFPYFETWKKQIKEGTLDQDWEVWMDKNIPLSLYPSKAKPGRPKKVK